jgi:Right handed beta helix region
MRITAVLALLLAATVARAESADLRLRVGGTGDSGTPVQAGSMFYGNTFLDHLGPDPARNVVVELRIEGLPEAELPCPGGICALGDVPVRLFVPVPQIRVQLPKRDVTFRVTATVRSDTPDPDPSNNTDTRVVTVRAAPLLQLYVEVRGPIDPGRPFEAMVVVNNYGFVDAHDVVTTLDLPDGITAVALPEPCTAAGARVTCREARVAGSTSYAPVVYRLTLSAPPRYEGGELRFVASTTAREPNFTGKPATSTATTFLLRTFFVTTTADDGPGSLRTAMHDVNAQCDTPVPCTIRFAIAEPGPHPWQTIRVRSPLPPLRGRTLYIDGATQRELAPDPAFAGKFIEIHGGGTVASAALDLAFSYASVQNLAINGFDDYAIRLGGNGNASVRGNFLGTDPSGSFAVPNRRGIHITGSSCFYPFPTIENNVISGNLRAGIFALGGCYTISANRIGVRAFDDAPLPNGASGIYLDTGRNRVEVSRNVIAFNREMGIAVHPASRYSALLDNRVWGNGTQAIDVGLNGPTSHVETDGGALATPVIVSAVYDPARGKTVVRFFGEFQATIQLFASDGPGMPLSGDMQRLVGATSGLVPPGPRTTEINGDLRGQWITATASRWIYHTAADIYPLQRTSEVSAAVQVE